MYLHRRRGSDRPAPFAPTFVPPAGSWAGPFVMEGVNARIVQLSNALAPQPYGTDFKQVAGECGRVGHLLGAHSHYCCSDGGGEGAACNLLIAQLAMLQRHTQKLPTKAPNPNNRSPIHTCAACRYQEMVATGSGWGGWLAATAVSVGTGLIGLAFAIAPLRALLAR
jgi:hypothetical protein